MKVFTLTTTTLQNKLKIKQSSTISIQLTLEKLLPSSAQTQIQVKLGLSWFLFSLNPAPDWPSSRPPEIVLSSNITLQ